MLPISSSVRYGMFCLKYRSVIQEARNFQSLAFPVFGKNGKDKKIVESSCVVQDGLGMQELPIIFKKTNNILLVCDRGGKQLPAGGQMQYNVDKEQIGEMIDAFSRCFSVPVLLKLLETVPRNEMTPEVCVSVLGRFLDLEKESFNYRNELMPVIDQEHRANTFARIALLNQLIDVICKSTDASVVLSALKIVVKDPHSFVNEDYQERLLSECLSRFTENVFSVAQVCDLMMTLRELPGDWSVVIEGLWTGIDEKAHRIDRDTLLEIFRVLPHLTISRKVVYSSAQKRTFDLWDKLTPFHVSEILYCIVQLLPTPGVPTSALLVSLSEWIKLNLHTFEDDHFVSALESFTKLKYTDEALGKVVEKFIKARKAKLSSASYVVIANFCVEFQYRSPIILDLLAKHVIDHHSSLTALQIAPLIIPFGQLNYVPPEQTFEFFYTVEHLLSRYFFQLNPFALVRIMLSCVYLQRYPLNFVKKIFNPFFLDRIHSLPSTQMFSTRSMLQVFDLAMTLECETYKGPMLPKNTFIWEVLSNKVDPRIATRLVNQEIRTALEKIVGDDREALTFGKIHPSFPKSNLYFADVIVDFRHSPRLQEFRERHHAPYSRYVLVVNRPEFFAKWNGELTLTGPEAMRRRHFEKRSIKFVPLDFGFIRQLGTSELENYLKICLDLK